MVNLIYLLAVEGLIAFISVNYIYIHNVFIKSTVALKAFWLKAIYLMLVLVAYTKIGSFDWQALAFLVVSIAIGIRYLRILKDKHPQKAVHSANINYYWRIYLNEFLRPIVKIFLIAAIATTIMHLSANGWPMYFYNVDLARLW